MQNYRGEHKQTITYQAQVPGTTSWSDQTITLLTGA